MKKISMLVLAFGMILGMVLPAQAKDKSAAAAVKTAKEVQGEISMITKDYISIIYHREEEKGVDYEIILPIDKDLRLVHKRDLSQINPGDIVRVQYEETSETDKKGPKSSRKAKVITFVKPAMKK